MDYQSDIIVSTDFGSSINSTSQNLTTGEIAIHNLSETSITSTVTDGIEASFLTINKGFVSASASDGVNLSEYYINSNGTIDISSNDNVRISNIDGAGIDLYYIDVNLNGIQITGTSAVYAADYSSTYTNRSLVDKEYVDNVTAVPAGATAGSFGITIDGGGSAITTGVKGYVEIPYDGTITGWTILADQTGSCVIDVWKDTYANFPPTVADTIAGSEKPTLSSAIKNEDLTLTTWTTSVTTGDIIAFNVDSASTVTRVTLSIKITKL